MSHVMEEEEEECDVLYVHRFYPVFIWIFIIIGMAAFMLAIGAAMLTSPNISLKDNAAAASSTPLRSFYLSKASLLYGPAPFLKNSSETLKEIDRYSTLEVKTVAIGEIVVQSKDHNLLTTYVHDVLKETNVISDAHKEAIHALVKLSPPEALVNLVETGQQGTLRNSELMAMIKRDEDHIHFMLIGVQAEPRLGWRSILPAARNLWNDALSRFVAHKVRAQTIAHLMHPPCRTTVPRARAAKVGQGM